MWVFDVVADGLTVAKDGLSLLKPVESSEKTKIGESNTFFKSTHAFTGRMKQQQLEEDEKEGKSKTDLDATSAGKIRVRFCGNSAAAAGGGAGESRVNDNAFEPVYLFGLAPKENFERGTEAETKEEFDKRVLGTPLSWEEPHSFFFECSRKGIFFWSESAMAYGTPISKRGLFASSSSVAGSSSLLNEDCVLELEWKKMLKGETIEDGTVAGAARTFMSIAVCSDEKCSTYLPLKTRTENGSTSDVFKEFVGGEWPTVEGKELVLVPHVTIMQPGGVAESVKVL